jgi:PEGA domain
VPSQPTELNIFSEPFGAEIDLDGAFIGNTPFRVVVPSGQHLISLRLAGYGPWKKMISAAGGNLEVDADLSPGGINGDVVSHCSTPDCVDSSVSNVAKKPNQKQVRQAPTPPR